MPMPRCSSPTCSATERNKISWSTPISARQELLSRADELQPIFEKHGIRLRMDVLVRPRNAIWRPVFARLCATQDQKRTKTPLQSLDQTLEDLDRWRKPTGRARKIIA